MHQVRIISGQWRSRRLKVAELPMLRPTPNRVRETLFNWLGQQLTGWHCLDLFAGTGALGFEAASRGAEKVVMIEQQKQLFLNLKNFANSLSAKQVEIYRQDAVKFIQQPQEPFDLLFLDPPFHQDWIARIEPYADNLLKPQALIYIESEQPIHRFAQWHTFKQGKAGQVYYHLLKTETIS